MADGSTHAGPPSVFDCKEPIVGTQWRRGQALRKWGGATEASENFWVPVPLKTGKSRNGIACTLHKNPIS